LTDVVSDVQIIGDGENEGAEKNEKSLNAAAGNI